MQEQKEWLSVAEVSAKFGISTCHVYRNFQRGNIPFIKIGSLYRIPKWWVEKQVASFSISDTP